MIVIYGRNFSGGKNKTHGQIEAAHRIDSFEAMRQGYDGALLTSGGVLVDCGRYMEYGPGDQEREIVEIWGGDTLELTRLSCGFGGSRAFWLCPRCRERARYLYFSGGHFLCRHCARLNYRSQQRTKNSVNHAYDGLKLARERLSWEPPFPVAPVDFPGLTPERPKGMHRTTYRRHLARFRRYQDKYTRDNARELAALLGRWR